MQAIKDTERPSKKRLMFVLRDKLQECEDDELLDSIEEDLWSAWDQI